jgi:hypothetical protein
MGVDAATGQPLWRVQAGAQVFADLLLLPQGQVLVATQAGTLLGLRLADGHQVRCQGRALV